MMGRDVTQSQVCKAELCFCPSGAGGRASRAEASHRAFANTVLIFMLNKVKFISSTHPRILWDLTESSR